MTSSRIGGLLVAVRLTDFLTEKHGFETKLWSSGARPHKCPGKEDFAQGKAWAGHARWWLLTFKFERILEEGEGAWKVKVGE